jgi:hypothetical protein
VAGRHHTSGRSGDGGQAYIDAGKQLKHIANDPQKHGYQLAKGSALDIPYAGEWARLFERQGISRRSHVCGAEIAATIPAAARQLGGGDELLFRAPQRQHPLALSLF